MCARGRRLPGEPLLPCQSWDPAARNVRGKRLRRPRKAAAGGSALLRAAGFRRVIALSRACRQTRTRDSHRNSPPGAVAVLVLGRIRDRILAGEFVSDLLVDLRKLRG